MLPINRSTPGYIYILHFSHPLGNTTNPRGSAGHYLGWAIDVERRIEQHLAGRSGVPIVAAALRAGIELRPHILGAAPKDTEYHLKNHVKNTPSLCPDCARAAGRTPRALPQLAEQLDMFDLELPPAPAGLVADRYEYLMLRFWRQARAAYTPAIDLAVVDSLL